MIVVGAAAREFLRSVQSIGDDDTGWADGRKRTAFIVLPWPTCLRMECKNDRHRIFRRRAALHDFLESHAG